MIIITVGNGYNNRSKPNMNLPSKRGCDLLRCSRPRDAERQFFLFLKDGNDQWQIINY